MSVTDWGYAIRRLGQKPGFTLIAIAVLALGIGANTGIFAVINAVLLRPLPYTEGKQLVWIGETLKGNTTDQVTLTPDFLQWREENTVFTGIAAFNIGSRTFSGGSEPLQVEVAKASADFLPILEVQPILGRNFRREEDKAGKDGVTLISHRLWREEFGEDARVLGKSVHIDDRLFTIIGVLPAEFFFPSRENVDLVTPLAKNEADELKRANGVTIVHDVIARLKPGVSLQQAQAETQLIQSRLSPPAFLRNAAITVNVLPLADRFTGNQRDLILIIFAASGFLLLLACASLATLLLSNAASRQREVAIRAALGATTWRIASLGIIETGILAACGCVLAITATFATRTVLVSFLRLNIPGLKLTVDTKVLAFAISLSALVAVGCGLTPVFFAWGKNVAESLTSAGHTFTTARGRQRAVSLLVSAQFAIAVLLITGAGLLVQSFWKMRYRDLGFQSEHVIAAELHLSKQRFPDAAKQAIFADELLQQVQHMPGVEAAAIGELPPGEGHATNGFAIEGQIATPSGRRPVARRFSVTREYFHSLGIPILRGRGLLPTDNATAQPVVVVNQAFAEKNFPNGNVIGARIRAEKDEPWQTVIGIVANVKTAGLMKEPEPTFYRPFAQFGATDDIGLLVRTSTSLAFFTPQLRHALAQIDAGQALLHVDNLSERLSDSASQPREASILFAAFALIALLIASIGLYGTMSLLVNGKLREMGIRLSLGAQPGKLVCMILRQSVKITAIGVIAGVLVAIWLSRYLQSLLYRTSPLDAATFTASVSFLFLVSMAAAYAPARKAAQVDPASTLRCE